MKEEFHFDYTEGYFKKQFRLLNDYADMDYLLLKSSSEGELSLVIYPFL